ncbi:MAG: type V CRISPR-associated endonuclease Cas1, partial [Bacteroidetes bacterium HGW-Bacteroidetes-12]
FEKKKNAFYLKPENRQVYVKVFFEAIIQHKAVIYKYIQQYYRCFMGNKNIVNYPIFSYE